MNCIFKYYKKKRLIEKYTPNYISQLYMMKFMADDEIFLEWYRHQILCELNCLRRLKNLK